MFGRSVRGTRAPAVAASTALQTAAAGMSSNTFLEFIQSSFWTRTAHPAEAGAPLDFFDCNVGEDGANALGHTMIDFGGKWVYDPTGKQGMYMAVGANPTGQGGGTRPYSYLWNARVVYDEASNTWTAARSIKCPNEGSDPDVLVHILHNNAIDISGRVHYKKKFRTAEIMRFNLQTQAFIDTIPSPSNEASGDRSGALEFIPTRGTVGTLWLYGVDSGTDRGRIWEWDPATDTVAADWAVIVDQPAFGTSAVGTGPVMSYNPRAFSGAGGVLVGGGSGAFTVRCDNLTVAGAGTPPMTLNAPNGAKLTRHPTGTGWLFYSSTHGYLYSCDGSTWTQLVQLPGDLADTSNTYPAVLCPIDEYGVIWIIAGQLPNRGATNGMHSLLYKP